MENKVESKGLKEFLRTLKYALVAASAGLIQFGVEELLSKAVQMRWAFAYFIALVLSVVWNFTINRKMTFKSVGNIPIAMLKVVGYYCVFTPLSLWFGDWLETVQGWDTTWITILNIAINGVTEYLFMRFFVFGKTIDTAVKKEKDN